MFRLFALSFGFLMVIESVHSESFARLGEETLSLKCSPQKMGRTIPGVNYEIEVDLKKSGAKADVTKIRMIQTRVFPGTSPSKKELSPVSQDGAVAVFAGGSSLVVFYKQTDVAILGDEIANGRANYRCVKR